MGNIISDPSDHFVKSNTVLKNIIEEWAINDYDAGINYNRQPGARPIKNLLKKRACCTRTEVMRVALPDIDLEGDKLIKDGYAPISIRIFDDKQMDDKDPSFNRELCKIQNEDSNDVQVKKDYYQSVLEKGNAANESCRSIYMSGSTDLKLCKRIKTENNLIYKNASQGAYGYYAKEQKYEDLFTNGNYFDCSCINSTLRDIDMSTFDTNINNKETVVQTNDSYCALCSGAGKCFIPTNEKINESLCINISNVRNLVSEYNSNITNSQSCSTNYSYNGNRTPEGELPPDTNDISIIIEKYKASIIIGFIVLISTIIGTIVLLK
jgi:hypothetical protein